MNVIDYPVKPHNIVLLGKPDNFVRSFNVRPIRAGYYSLIVAPSDVMRTEHFLRYDLEFPDLQGAPAQIVIEIPEILRKQDRWQWKLVCWPDFLQPRLFTQLFQDLALHVTPAETSRVVKDISTVDLFFLYQETSSGNFRLDEASLGKGHRFIMWSCNQPFDTAENGELVLQKTTEPVVQWYHNQVTEFDPDLIWILGDAAYADGTDASNFIDSYYGQVGWASDPYAIEALRRSYRNMYRAHWSFTPMQRIMGSYPHACVWDDHEIRDGWGSEDADLDGHNAIIYKIARSVADEYLLNNGPRVRSPAQEPDADAHQAYFAGNIAGFIFDGRSSRRYHGQQGHVVSEQQFKDFETFCDQVAERGEVKFLVMGCGVPFINLRDFAEELGAKASKELTDLAMGIRDDVRDSWHSPGNKAALKKLINVLRKLHYRRGDIEIVNLSGDIHVANAFTFQPMGFRKALYQITSSALTNRQHMPDIASDLLAIGTEAFSDTLGVITRVWQEVSDPNLLVISNNGDYLRFELKVFDLENPPAQTSGSVKDKVLDVGAHSLMLSYVV